MEIAYYPGCTLNGSSSLYDLQNRRIFSDLGIELKEIEDWNCCGATSAGKVDDLLAMAMPARNIGLAEAGGFSEMVIPCSACYSKTLVAQKYLQDDASFLEEINRVFSTKVQADIKVSSILEVLLTKVNSGELAQKTTRPLKGLKPACYYGCLQTRFPSEIDVPDDVENPQNMETILKVLGADAVDWSYKTDCCGASAVINDEETAMDLMGNIMTDAIGRNADCLVVTCPMCQLNMDAYQDKFCEKHEIEKRLPVYFITEMVGFALGMGIEELQIDRHFIDGSELLKEFTVV